MWLWSISWDQLVKWHQFYELSPWDDERADMREAIIGTAVVNEIRAARREWGAKGLKFLKVEDLLLNFDEKDKKGNKKKDSSDASEYHRLWVEDHERRKADILASKHRKPA